jgi:prolyl oligopeptidase
LKTIYLQWAARLSAAMLMVNVAHAQSLPKAAVKNVQDTYFGTKVDDPYRYFEQKSEPEVAAWMKAHSDNAYAQLHHIAGRDALLARIRKLDDSVSSRVAGVQRVPGDIYFYEKRGAADNQFKLYKQAGLKGKEQLLVDPDVIQKKTGKPHAINYFFPSPDGRYVAYGLSQQGSEAAFLHVLDTTTGKSIGEPISRADYGSVDWAPDSKSFNFNRLQEVKKGMPETEKYQRSAAFHVRVPGGMDAKPVISMTSAGVTMTPIESPVTWTTHDGRWLIAVITNGVQREIGLYVTAFADAQNNRYAWRRIATAPDKVVGFAYFNDIVYLQSNKNASRGQVLALPLAPPRGLNKVQDVNDASVVVPKSDRVITGIAAASDALYIEAREGNAKHLFKRAYENNAALVEVKLPVYGTFSLVGFETLQTATDPRLPGAVIDLESWTQGRQIYSVGADGSVVNTELQPKGPYDAPSDIEATEVLVKSYDGAMVPMSIIHKKGVKLDGNNPTLLNGYASYGITQEPRFNTTRLAWLEQGGVFAVANPRGSGVFGEDWYKGGYQSTKPNTWKDFIACAEYLIAQKYTQPSKLGIIGGSAGGILVGRAMTERPDLFAAVIAAVGALDGIRFESTANGVTNIPEFGTVKNEAGFKALLAMSTYHNIKDGVKYPAVIFTHGVNDPRVEVWESTKTAARMMAASSSGKPILMRLDYDAGHGVGNTKAQQQEERADTYSFLLWNMGVKGFELKQ